MSTTDRKHARSAPAAPDAEANSRLVKRAKTEELLQIFFADVEKVCAHEAEQRNAAVANHKFSVNADGEIVDADTGEVSKVPPLSKTALFMDQLETVLKRVEEHHP